MENEINDTPVTAPEIAPPTGDVVSTGAVPDGSEAPVEAPAPSPEPVEPAPVESVPAPVQEPPVSAPADPVVTDAPAPVADPTPAETPAPTPEPTPEVEPGPVVPSPSPVADVPPPPVVAAPDEQPATPPVPSPADEATDSLDADVSDYESLSAQIETLGHEIADHVLLIDLEGKRAAYEDLKARWSEAAQKVHAARYGARTATPPVPEFKIMSPCSRETLDWLNSFFGLHVSAAE